MKRQSFVGLSSAALSLSMFISLTACDKVNLTDAMKVGGQLAGVGTAEGGAPGGGMGGSPIAEKVLSNISITVPPALAASVGNAFYNFEVGRRTPERDKSVIDQVEIIFTRLQEAARANPTYGAVAKEIDWKLNTLHEQKPATARAFPGGGIALYTGLFKAAETEDVLAAILGHEMAHLLARHHLQNINGDTARALKTIQESLSSGTSLDKIDPKVVGLVAGAMGVGYIFDVRQPLQREKELEADCLGLQLSAKAGYDPIETETFWEEQAKKPGTNDILQLLNDHPPHKDRHAHIRSKCLPDAQQIYGQVTNGQRQKEPAPLLTAEVAYP